MVSTDSAAAPNYTFAVLDERKRSFPLTFSPADKRAKECFQSVWKRLSGAVEAHHKADGSPMPDWGRWSPWDWCLSSKPELAGREMVIAWCGNRMVGFLSLWSDFDSQVTAGLKTLYVEHLGAFPGDLETAIWGRQYRGVGSTLLGYAVLRSVEKGFDGRLSLHASNAEALEFYRAVQKKLGSPLFHPERTGVLGPTPHAARGDSTKTYLETTESGARAWLEGYRNA